jgi:hypothetical protein
VNCIWKTKEGRRRSNFRFQIADCRFQICEMKRGATPTLRSGQVGTRGARGKTAILIKILFVRISINIISDLWPSGKSQL